MSSPSSFEERLTRLRSGQESARDLIHVGWCLVYGVGVTQNVKDGIHWLERASSLGSGEAKIRLAEILQSAELVERDCEAVRRLYDEASKTEGFHGLYGYALAKYTGTECVSIDEDAAYDYFGRASQRGHLVSQVLMRKMERTGKFGAGKLFLGYLLVLPIAVRAILHVLKNDPGDALWDAGRWLPNTGLISRFRRGTRFE